MNRLETFLPLFALVLIYLFTKSSSLPQQWKFGDSSDPTTMMSAAASSVSDYIIFSSKQQVGNVKKNGKESDLIWFPPGQKKKFSTTSTGKPATTTDETRTDTEVLEEPPLSEFCPETSPVDEEYTRYDEMEKKCTKIGSQQHCPEHMRFYSYPQSKTFGQCDCIYDNGDQKPYVYSLEKNKCYQLFEQGFCDSREWLTIDKDGLPTCSKNGCQKIFFGTALQNSSAYVLYKGECVKLNSPFRDCKEKEIISFELGNLVPKCMTLEATSTRALGSIHNLKCAPGTYLTISGKCQKTFKWD